MINSFKNTVFITEKEAIDNVATCSKDINEYFINDSKDIFYFMDLMREIKYVLKYWTGQTNVGVEKSSDLKMAYQRFFDEFMKMLLLFKSRTDSKWYEKAAAKKYLYQGTVYRYLGNHNKSIKNLISVNYDEIFVSWNKDKVNSYIISKLKGKKLLLTCEIYENNYGIDLEELGVSVGSEREVVFPTIKETIINEEVID